MTFAAILFGGGEGTRIGGPKALLSVDGEPLALRHAGRFLDAGVTRVVVAVPKDAASLLRARLRSGAPPDILAVDTKEPKETILAGLRHLAGSSSAGGSSPEAIFVFPIDGGPVLATTIRALAAIFSPSVRLVTPELEGRGGHPVLLSRDLLEELPTFEHLRALVRHHESVRHRVSTEDRAIVQDVDTPEDFARVYGGAPRFIGKTAEP